MATSSADALDRLTAAAVPLDNGRVGIHWDPRGGGYDPTPDLDLTGVDYVVAVTARPSGFRFEWTPSGALPGPAAGD